MSHYALMLALIVLNSLSSLIPFSSSFFSSLTCGVLFIPLFAAFSKSCI
nr:MAG TPA: hypothetical protein [Bacteriophage sp.]